VDDPGYFTPTDLPETLTKAMADEKEISIRKPTPFKGDRTKIQAFIQECRGYLQLNKRIYTDDEAKVAFILSFLTEGEALQWKEVFLASITNTDGEFVYPAIKDFVILLTAHFKPINQFRTANNKLAMLKQGKRPVEEMVTEFRLLTTLAGMPAETEADNIHLINYFQRALNPTLMRKIALAADVPTTISGWVERAIQYDTNYRMTMEMIGAHAGKTEYKPKRQENFEYSWRKKATPERDPYAMDVDAMSTEKQSFLMRKGACFVCEGVGHRASDHKPGGSHYEEKKKGRFIQQQQKKNNVREIHALLQGLTKEERQELVDMQPPGGSKKKEEKKEEGKEEEVLENWDGDDEESDF
jgi:hypothetical protein